MAYSTKNGVYFNHGLDLNLEFVRFWITGGGNRSIAVLVNIEE